MEVPMTELSLKQRKKTEQPCIYTGMVYKQAHPAEHSIYLQEHKPPRFFVSAMRKVYLGFRLYNAVFV